MSEWTGKCCPNCGALPCHWTDPPNPSSDGLVERLLAPSYWKSSEGYSEAFDRAPYAAADTITALEREVAVLREALEPSGYTKAAYIGEFSFGVEISHPRLGSEMRKVDVPWTTIKEIMAAICKRADQALASPRNQTPEE